MKEAKKDQKNKKIHKSEKRGVYTLYFFILKSLKNDKIKPFITVFI